MKKVLTMGLAFLFLAGALTVFAKETKEEKDFSKPLAAGNVVLQKKKPLSKEERKIMDENIKGKPSNIEKGKPASEPKEGATGVLGEPVKGNKYAIIIGLSNYIGTDNDLCVNATTDDYPNSLCKDGDALSMEDTLVNIYGYSKENISRFSDTDAKFGDINSTVQNILDKANADDEIVFFFSGHSATSNTDPDGDGEIIDEGLALYNGDIIWDGALEDWFKDAHTSRILFAFDTCKAGGMDDLEKDGRVLAMSSSESRYSYTYYLGGEDDNLGEGMFTHYFVNEGMRAGLADGFNLLKKNNPEKYDDNVVVEEAYSFARKYVPLSTSNYQIPEISDKFFNDLLL